MTTDDAPDTEPSPAPAEPPDTSSESPRALTMVPPRRRSSDSWRFDGLKDALEKLDEAREKAGLTEKDCEEIT